jgi:hypothetical protein
LFKGPLSFGQTLRELIPSNGFSDPPDVRSPRASPPASASDSQHCDGASLENLGLAAGFAVPFVGPPLSTYSVLRRENRRG